MKKKNDHLRYENSETQGIEPIGELFHNTEEVRLPKINIKVDRTMHSIANVCWVKQVGPVSRYSGV
jgi:hypothetical protein